MAEHRSDPARVETAGLVFEMKTNLKYNWRITLSAPGHSLSIVKRLTIEEAIQAADELETMVEWVVTSIVIHQES